MQPLKRIGPSQSSQNKNEKAHIRHREMRLRSTTTLCVSGQTTMEYTEPGLHHTPASRHRKRSISTETLLNPPAAVNNKRCILCVDDEIVGTEMLGEILKEQGYEVVLCHCPFAALCHDLSRFQLAILDFQMPGLNGRELLLRLRAQGARFPIVLLTGCLDRLSHEDCVLFARCHDKSMPVQSLLKTIAEFLDPLQLPDYGA